jgi:hypothetical protein
MTVHASPPVLASDPPVGSRLRGRFFAIPRFSSLGSSGFSSKADGFNEPTHTPSPRNI